MSTELTLFLVRHGETTYNAEGRFQGSQDIPLSDRGHEQARALRSRLREAWSATPPLLPGPPCAVFSSHLSRAAETAQVLADAVPGSPPIRTTPLLQERYYGTWEGLTTAEIRERYGQHSHPENAESYDQVRERMGQALSLIWQETLSGKESAVALVVGHGGSLRFIFSQALGISTEAVRRMQMDNTGLSIIRFRGASPETAEGRLILFNDISHLASLGFIERPRATPPR